MKTASILFIPKYHFIPALYVFPDLVNVVIYGQGNGQLATVGVILVYGEVAVRQAFIV